MDRLTTTEIWRIWLQYSLDWHKERGYGFDSSKWDWFCHAISEMKSEHTAQQPVGEQDYGFIKAYRSILENANILDRAVEWGRTYETKEQYDVVLHHVLLLAPYMPINRVYEQNGKMRS